MHTYASAADEPAPNSADHEHTCEDVSPSDAFEKLIWENPRTCANCYNRVSSGQLLSSDEEEERTLEMATFLKTRSDIASYVRIGVPDDDDQGPDEWRFTRTTALETRSGRVAGREPTKGLKRCCGVCGVDNMGSHHENLGKVEAVNLTEGISETLLEYGHAHDWLVLVERTRMEQKQDDEDSDKAMFGNAVERAIEAANDGESNWIRTPSDGRLDVPTNIPDLLEKARDEGEYEGDKRWYCCVGKCDSEKPSPEQLDEHQIKDHRIAEIIEAGRTSLRTAPAAIN